MTSVDGRDVTSQPYVERREILESLMVDESAVLTVPKAYFGVSAADMLDVAREHQMEGVVSKLVTSRYREGRSPWWVKTPVRQTAELVLVAFAGRPGRVGSLLVAGHRDDGALELVGQVGTGFSAVVGRQLFEVLHPLEREVPPVVNPIVLPGYRWVEPRYVGEVAFREYGQGRGLRHASWKGLRNLDPALARVP